MDDSRRAYWRTNLEYVGMLPAIRFSVSLGAGVLFADALDAIPFFGFKLGFWFAQQGSIYTFAVSIGVSSVTALRPERVQQLVEDIRIPRGAG